MWNFVQIKLTLIIYATVLSIPVFGQGVGSNKFDKQVEQHINAHVHNGKFNGNLLIAKGDSVLYSSSFGMANRAHQVRHSNSTKFLIGSITKPFTSLAILILERQNKLRLEDKLSKYFPDFPADSWNLLWNLRVYKTGRPKY